MKAEQSAKCVQHVRQTLPVNPISFLFSATKDIADVNSVKADIISKQGVIDKMKKAFAESIRKIKNWAKSVQYAIAVSMSYSIAYLAQGNAIMKVYLEFIKAAYRGIFISAIQQVYNYIQSMMSVYTLITTILLIIISVLAGASILNPFASIAMAAIASTYVLLMVKLLSMIIRQIIIRDIIAGDKMGLKRGIPYNMEKDRPTGQGYNAVVTDANKEAHAQWTPGSVPRMINGKENPRYNYRKVNGDWTNIDAWNADNVQNPRSLENKSTGLSYPVNPLAH